MSVENVNRASLLSYSATFIALIAAGSWVSIPFFPVPLTLQTFFVLLAGVVMRKHAAIPVLLYVALGALNLPLFHNGTAGVGVLLGPTGGFLIGFIPAAALAGLSYESESRSVRIGGLILATLAIYACGVSWLSFSASIPLLESFLLGAVPFIPGDAVKLFAAYRIGKRLE
ncbi:MAG: biotin transporter BioY [Candidatus Methanomethylophilaceae archaeon]|nr:biotin transporter BioY [Candidatus Methanomethylophilaceae archaeon]